MANVGVPVPRGAKHSRSAGQVGAKGPGFAAGASASSGGGASASSGKGDLNTWLSNVVQQAASEDEDKAAKAASGEKTAKVAVRDKGDIEWLLSRKNNKRTTPPGSIPFATASASP